MAISITNSDDPEPITDEQIKAIQRTIEQLPEMPLIGRHKFFGELAYQWLPKILLRIHHEEHDEYCQRRLLEEKLVKIVCLNEEHDIWVKSCELCWQKSLLTYGPSLMAG